MPNVESIMSRNLVTAAPGESLAEAARRMDERKVGAALVLDGGALKGIVTERDVLRTVAAGRVESSTVADCMTADPETAEPSESVGQAAVLMIHGGFRHLPVVDGGRVVGIVSIRDLIQIALDDEAPRGV
jgi:CBS domain-containing protein